MKIDRVEIVKTKSPYFRDISTRDWLAGQALNGLLSKMSLSDNDQIVKYSYFLADKMIEVGNGKTN